MNATEETRQNRRRKRYEVSRFFENACQTNIGIINNAKFFANAARKEWQEKDNAARAQYMLEQSAKYLELVARNFRETAEKINISRNLPNL